MQMLQRSSQYSIFYSWGEVRIRCSTEITWRLLEGIQFYFLEKPQQTCLVKRCCDRLLVQYQERFACQPGLPVELFGMCAIRDVLFEMGSMVLVRTGLTWWSVSASGYNPPEQQSNVRVSAVVLQRCLTWRRAEQQEAVCWGAGSHGEGAWAFPRAQLCAGCLSWAVLGAAPSHPQLDECAGESFPWCSPPSTWSAKQKSTWSSHVSGDPLSPAKESVKEKYFQKQCKFHRKVAKLCLTISGSFSMRAVLLFFLSQIVGIRRQAGLGQNFNSNESGSFAFFSRVSGGRTT